MSIETPTPPVVYRSHANTIDWSEFVFVWDRLSDFWDLVDNRGLVTAYWEGWYFIRDRITDYLERHRYNHCLMSPFYLGGLEPYWFELELSDENRVPGTEHSYYIDPLVSYNIHGEQSKVEYIRDIVLVQDFIQEPTLVYGSDDASTHVITFNTGIRNADQGIITFHDSDYMSPEREWGDGKYRMWVTGWRAKSRDQIIGRFGPMTSYEERVEAACPTGAGVIIEHNKAELGTLMDIMGLFYVQQFGPVIPNLEIGLFITNDWPYSPLGGVVREINGTDSITIELSNGEFYSISNITGLPFQIEGETGWTDLGLGDEIPGLTPLVHALDISDIYTDPTYWQDLPIGEAERWHTFAVLFNGEMACDGTTAATYPIDCGATMAFLNRNKPIGDKPFMRVLLDVIPTVDLDTLFRPLPWNIIGAIIDNSGFWDLNNVVYLDGMETNAFTIYSTVEYWPAARAILSFANHYGILLGGIPTSGILDTSHVSHIVEETVVVSGGGWTSYGYSY